jgi:predicted ABC-type ATPase
MSEQPRPVFLMIAGPNGAGKTTTAMHLLPEVLHIRHFVNADLVAKGLSPFDPMLADLQAGKLMVKKIHELTECRESFAVETTLASRSFVSVIRRCQGQGYWTELLFIALPSPELAKERVAHRVERGGHDVPVEVIEKRFYKGLTNFFNLYEPHLNAWTLVENKEKTMKKIAERRYAKDLTVFDKTTFAYYKNLVTL